MMPAPGVARAVVLAVAVLCARPAAAEPLPPNELGRVMILEYHKIDHPENRWTRTPDNFRRDLQRLWERGYRLIGLNDFLDGRILLPPGTTPVILTFDDSSPGQFRYVERQGEWVIDPDCAVGIIEAFARAHPEFGRAATFYVLPGADPPNRLFNQPALATRKLTYLATNGYEIGNHTLWHANLSRYPEPVVRTQIATAQEWIQRHVPGYRPRTLALPMGGYPRETRWAETGAVNGTAYRHDAILMVAGGTGGHIYPALAVAEELRQRSEAGRGAEFKIEFLGTTRSLETRLIPSAGVEPTVRSQGLPRSPGCTADVSNVAVQSVTAPSVSASPVTA